MLFNFVGSICYLFYIQFFCVDFFIGTLCGCTLICLRSFFFGLDDLLSLWFDHDFKLNNFIAMGLISDVLSDFFFYFFYFFTFEILCCFQYQCLVCVVCSGDTYNNIV